MPTSPFLDWNGNTFGITDEALWVNIRNTTSTAVPVTPTGDGVISAGNTTEVNLAGGATFDGTFENCLEYGAIRVAIYSSHASASRGLEFWCSKDGSNGFIDDSYTVPAATPKTYAVPVSAPYFKLRYTNGGTTTTTLKICCIFQRNVSVVSSHRLGDTVTDDDDAQLINAVLKAKLPNNTYANIDATAGGNLKVSIEEVDAGAFPFQTTITDGTDTAEIMTGPVDGAKGLRVFIGPTDPISDIPVVMDYGQHQVHEGETYGWEYYSAAPATRNFAIVVPTYANTSR